MKKIFIMLLVISVCNISSSAHDIPEERAGSFISISGNIYVMSENKIEYVEPDYDVELFGSVAPDWNVAAVNAQIAWNIGCYGNDIKVAVIDSGVYAHPDLSGNILSGYNYIGSSTDTTDNIGHGTFVSGIIAAENNDQYITGIAHKSKIVPLKCFDTNTTTKVSLIANAICDAVDVYGCKVINMSFGLPENSSALEKAVNYALSKGVILVAAVGNKGTSAEYYPASYSGVIGVGSVGASLSVSSFSDYNESVDVVAPGENLTSVSISGYTGSSGTSFSAPHVTAAAADALCVNRSLTPQEFASLISQTSTDLGSTGYDDYYGYGLLNIKNIVDKMLANTATFISPIDISGDTANIVVYNNSLSSQSLTGIFAGLDDLNSDMLSCVSDEFTLAPKATKKLSYPSSQSTIKYFLWDSFNNMKPAAYVKIYK